MAVVHHVGYRAIMESSLFPFSLTDVKWVTLGQLLTTENDRRLGWVVFA